MRISIIIVNYNVKFFLEQCLHSVEKALFNIDSEIIVVDNNSVDGSCNMIRKKFPGVILIENKINTGFSKANNQGIKIAKGDYILLLNPDTVVEENTFQKCLHFMDEHDDAGALSVKMIDGTGNFLPESKRGLPTPIVAFYKIFGLSAIFPKSKIFSKYHLGYLDKNKVNKIEILPGAFMLIRKKALEIAGVLDEDFFMYGEDIDLSYRIIKAGFSNYYFPETTIIHYKGESTKKSSINYVKVFYNAMLIFAKKHFTEKNANILSILINVAIYFRASISIINRFFKALFLPFFDALIAYFGFYMLQPIWAQLKFGQVSYYPQIYLTVAVPIYITIWVISIFFSGGYDKPIKILNLIKGISIGTLIILIIYSLLPENLRFSRFLLLIGTAWTFLTTIILRLLLYIVKIKWLPIDLKRKKKIAIIGNKTDCNRIKTIITKSDINSEFIGYIGIKENKKDIEFIGSIDQLNEIISINNIDELIFSGNDMSSQDIIKYMLILSEKNIDFKIAPPESFSIIGSNSIHTTGDLYLLNLNSIAKIKNQRNKKLIDICASMLLLLISPLLLPLYRKPFKFYKNIFKVLFGIYSWVGYHPELNYIEYDLPNIKKGILNPADKFENNNKSSELINKVNMVYAKDYKVLNDIEIIFSGLKKLDRAIH